MSVDDFFAGGFELYESDDGSEDVRTDEVLLELS